MECIVTIQYYKNIVLGVELVLHLRKRLRRWKLEDLRMKVMMFALYFQIVNEKANEAKMLIIGEFC